MFDHFTFLHPWFFLLLLLLPLAGWYYYYRQKDRYYASLPFPELGPVKKTTTWRTLLQQGLPLLRALALIALVTALARPRLHIQEQKVNAEGIDIFLVIDLSSSMLAQDFRPDRLEVSKQVAANFVDKRPYDRIGLAAFAGEALTECPLTTDHEMLKEFIGQLRCGMLEDGTAIGMGLATAVNRIKDSQSKSKVVILLTDGVNNAGYIKPMTAAEIAKEFGVRVYTIGVGTEGQALAPTSRRSDGRYQFSLTRVEIDEQLLTRIAELTGGKYFRATNERRLQMIYDEIDRLEKTKIEITTDYKYSEEYYRFVWAAVVLLLLEVLLRITVLRRLT
ncbi:MAG TPA: VWA domain-containing protein [Bacteroidetes bacterium]|nr:VWA domain-containing protein [Bacteroidota bacterium]